MRLPLQIAVVGSGIGAQHLQGYQEFSDLFDVKILCDIDRERAASVSEKFGIAEIGTRFDAVCRRPDIDVIDICTPPHLHFEQIKQALASGKHVICEKPLVGSLAALDSLSRLAKASGRKLLPIFQYRFGHGLQKLKYLVDRKLAGDAFVFNLDVAWWRSSAYYDSPWRGKRATEFGGALLSHAIHAVDMVLYILGGPAKTVFGYARTKVNQIEVEDCVALALEMADGSLGTISVTLGSLAQISRHRFTFRNVTAESNTDPYANSQEPAFKATELWLKDKVSNYARHGWEGPHLQASPIIVATNGCAIAGRSPGRPLRRRRERASIHGRQREGFRRRCTNANRSPIDKEGVRLLLA
jgi:predicted dehydrogenase